MLLPGQYAFVSLFHFINYYVLYVSIFILKNGLVFFQVCRSISIGSLFIVLFIPGTVFGYTGKEITIKLGNAQSALLNGTEYYKIIVNISYTVYDSNLIGKRINAVMKVHGLNGTVIKTTSFPSGFTANRADTARMVTNIPISAARNITTETVFTDLNKTNVLSNIVKTLPLIPMPTVKTK